MLNMNMRPHNFFRTFPLMVLIWYILAVFPVFQIIYTCYQVIIVRILHPPAYHQAFPGWKKKLIWQYNTLRNLLYISFIITLFSGCPASPKVYPVYTMDNFPVHTQRLPSGEQKIDLRQKKPCHRCDLQYTQHQSN